MRKDALSFDTEFEVEFYVNGIRYWYPFIVNPEKVCREILFVYLSNRPTEVFCREDADGVSKLNFNPAVAKLSQAEIEVMSMNCLRNMSVLAVLKKVNIAVPYLDNMRRWIDTRMLPLQSGTLSSLSSEAKKHIADSEDFREYLMKFAKEADFNISDIKIQKMAALFGHTVQNETGAEDYVMPEACQSTGTKRMVELESLIYTQLKRQAFLCVDEIEASMHPNLMEYILADFKGLNKLSSIHRAYMNGQFGALPNVL